MPRKTEMSLEELKNNFFMMKKLTLPIEKVEEAVKGGAKLTLEESLFSDPGPDYSAVFMTGHPTSIVYIPGY